MPVYACRVCGDPEPPEQCPWNKPDGALEAIPEWRELKEGV